MVQRYLLVFEYLGSAFNGTQRQALEAVKGSKLRTVQHCIERAFQKFTKDGTLQIALSSRTDAGVHALANTAHVDITRPSRKDPTQEAAPYEGWEVKRAINHFLKIITERTCQITQVVPVPPEFHARYSAVERRYLYRIFASKRGSPRVFDRDQIWHVHDELDIDRMQEAASYLLGTHDFTSFRAAGCQATSPIRTLDELSIQEVPSPMGWAGPAGEQEAGGRYIVVVARSRSFLYHQVRFMVGFLKAVGSGERDPKEAKTVLAAQDNQALKCNMAPGEGLYLMRVGYPDSAFETANPSNR